MLAVPMAHGFVLGYRHKCVDASSKGLQRPECVTNGLAPPHYQGMNEYNIRSRNRKDVKVVCLGDMACTSWKKARDSCIQVELSICFYQVMSYMIPMCTLIKGETYKRRAITKDRKPAIYSHLVADRHSVETRVCEYASKRANEQRVYE